MLVELGGVVLWDALCAQDAGLGLRLVTEVGSSQFGAAAAMGVRRLIGNGKPDPPCTFLCSHLGMPLLGRSMEMWTQALAVC